MEIDNSGAVLVSSGPIAEYVYIGGARLPVDPQGRLVVSGGSDMPVTVIDSLDSASASDALSANMGRELNERITAEISGLNEAQTETEQLL